MAFYTFVTICLQLQIQNTGLRLFSAIANLNIQIQIFLYFTGFHTGAVSVNWHLKCMNKYCKLSNSHLHALEFCYTFTFIAWPKMMLAESNMSHCITTNKTNDSS